MKKQKLSITIGHLYGDLMNIYGDNGNIICLRKRCEWRGISVKVLNISLKEALKPGLVDLYFFGGGQDQAQGLVSEDILTKVKAEAICKDVERGIPLLSICGGYQLLGEYYKPEKGAKLGGLGVFPAYTEASSQRMIGNIVVEVDSGQFTVDSFKHTPHLFESLRAPQSLERPGPLPKEREKLVGFENHSGKTFLRKGAQPLGRVISGFGNNGEDGFEGCVYKNAIGCYMHGSLLPKNPMLADWLITKALDVKYGKLEVRGWKLEELDDELEIQTHDNAVELFS